MGLFTHCPRIPTRWQSSLFRVVRVCHARELSYQEYFQISAIQSHLTTVLQLIAVNVLKLLTLQWFYIRKRPKQQGIFKRYSDLQKVAKSETEIEIYTEEIYEQVHLNLGNNEYHLLNQGTKSGYHYYQNEFKNDLIISW